MGFDFIPTQWKVGIKEVDSEHQELLELLQTRMRSEEYSIRKDMKCFEVFFERMNNLLTSREKNMEATHLNDFIKNNFREKNKRILTKLENLKESTSENLMQYCKLVLFEAIAEAEFYYRNFGSHERAQVA